MPWICRLAPGEHIIEFEWLDNGAPDMPHIVQWRPVFADADWMTQPITDRTVQIQNLDCWRDYELRVCREDGTAGVKRLARTGPVR